MNAVTEERIPSTTAVSDERRKEIKGECDDLVEWERQELKVITEASRSIEQATANLTRIREEKSRLIQELMDGESATKTPESEEAGLISNPSIAFAVQIAERVYGNRFEGQVLPSVPSIEAIQKAFAREEQQQEIAGRTEPTLRLTLVQDGDALHWRPVILDGPQEMPLETYEGQHVYKMNREERILASRQLNQNPQYRTELDHEDMTIYDLLAHGASAQGKPIDQQTWSILTAKFKKGDRIVWDADWLGDRSRCVKRHAVRVDQYVRLRFAVWGDVLS